MIDNVSNIVEGACPRFEFTFREIKTHFILELVHYHC